MAKYNYLKGMEIESRRNESLWIHLGKLMLSSPGEEEEVARFFPWESVGGPGKREMSSMNTEFVDSNILVYAHDPTTPAKHHQARLLGELDRL